MRYATVLALLTVLPVAFACARDDSAPTRAAFKAQLDEEWKCAYVEGWALYAESLGEEMGFYKDPYSKFGQLTYEMWRAVRLVVDTGLHSMHWTRQQAIDFFLANAAKTEQDIIVEVDRYIAWPGQALGYKLGQMKIQELRAAAAKQQGERFDLRRFHDAVLSEGAVPLDVLESRLKAWAVR